VLKKLIGSVVALIITALLGSIVAFALVHMLPGNPVSVILGPAATPSTREALIAQLGLNKPLVEQYLTWLNNFLHGHMGIAYSDRQAVASLLKQNYSETLELTLASQVIALILAIALAVFAGLKENKLMDKVFTSLSFGFFSIPPFVVAPILVILFAVKAKILPATGYSSLATNPAQNIKDMILPVATLALTTFPPYYQILRAELVRTLKENFVELAVAKGLSPLKVVIRHALKPSSLGLLTTVGLQLGSLITGAFVIEYIFQLPGLGELTINSINAGDYLVIQAIVVIVITAVGAINFIIDLLYAVLDPRIRSSK
jgi:peptide/nickel transport system permease protein